MIGGLFLTGNAGAGHFLSFSPSLKFLIYSFDALRPRRAPTFWPAESRQRLAEGLRPYRYPLCGRARVACGHNRARGVTELLAAYAAGASAQICGGVAAKAVSDAVPCAGAHDRQAFPVWERGGPGGEAPKRSGGGAAIVASAHALALSPTAPKLQPRKRRGVRPGLPRQRGLGGFQRGASSTPLWSGDSQGGETPLRLSLPTFCRSRK